MDTLLWACRTGPDFCCCIAAYRAFSPATDVYKRQLGGLLALLGVLLGRALRLGLLLLLGLGGLLLPLGLLAPLLLLFLLRLGCLLALCSLLGGLIRALYLIHI